MDPRRWPFLCDVATLRNLGTLRIIPLMSIAAVWNAQETDERQKESSQTQDEAATDSVVLLRERPGGAALQCPDGKSMCGLTQQSM